MKSYTKFVLLVILISVQMACVTTSTYGATFKEVDVNTFTLKMYYGGPTPSPTITPDFKAGTDTAIHKKAIEFIAENEEYSDYKIINVKHNLIPSYYLYTVEFE